LISKEFTEAFPRAISICPEHGALSHIAKELRDLMKAVLVPAGHCVAADIPTYASIVKVARATEGVSLRLLQQINRALRLILDHAHLDELKELAEYIADAIGPRGFCDGAFVLCLHRLRAKAKGTAYGEYREALARKDPRLGGIRYFSTRVLEHGELKEKAASLLYFLEEGYDIGTPENPGKGSYKITEATARVIHEGMVKLAAEHDVEPPLFDDVFSFGALSGTRNGHSSKALPPSNGNLMR